MCALRFSGHCVEASMAERHQAIGRLLAVPVLAVLLAAGVMAQGGGTSPANPASAQRAARFQKERDNVELQRSVASFRVFDNLYYVGIGYVSSWVLTTDQGLILIDTLEARHADHLLANIRSLGLDPRQIKYVLLTHGHYDHVGAAARIQQEYGARVVMVAGDANLFDGIGGPKPEAEAPRRDLIVEDGDTLVLGNATLRLAWHPGHTPGGLSAGFTVYDGGAPYEAYIFAGAAPAQGVAAAEQFVATIGRLERLQPRVQVRVVSHPFMDPAFWDRVDRLAARRPGDPHPFVVPGEFDAWIAGLKKVGTARLAEAKATSAGSNR
jgi:metallo-beta-lactamase class B